MLSFRNFLDAAIALGGGKQPLNERRPSSAKLISKTGVDPSPDGGGGGGALM